MFCKYKSLLLTLSLLSFVAIGCQRKEKVRLFVDFSNSRQWQYLLGADIRGVLECGDSLRSFSGSVRTYLSGLEPDREGTGRFETKDLLIKADFLSEEARLDLQHRLQTVEFSLSENEGIEISDTLSFPELPSGSWDLMRSIVRSVPALPYSEVTVGSSWERQYQFPLYTNQGFAMGELYQIFRLDSVLSSEETRLAHLSWFFSYRVSLNELSAIFGNEPLSGSGTGNAVIDITENELLKSNATFDVFHYDNCRIEINETIHLELIQ